MTRKVAPNAQMITLISVILLVFGSFLYQANLFKAQEWMPASSKLVFQHQEYWRLWTTLFAHADFAHLFGNLFLFVPFAFFLTGHFGIYYFPLLGLFMGGITNLIVLKTMPDQIHLIGASGIVYWMGATYLTLAFFIDHRESRGRQLMKLSGVALILFFPETLKPEVSYMSHLIGFIIGAMTATLVYFFFRSDFKKSIQFEYIIELEPKINSTDFENQPIYLSEEANRNDSINSSNDK